MTPTEWQKRSCGDKRQYGTRHRAKIASQQAAALKFKFDYYRCRFCKFYHLARTKEAKVIAGIINGREYATK